MQKYQAWIVIQLRAMGGHFDLRIAALNDQTIVTKIDDLFQSIPSLPVAVCARRLLIERHRIS